MTVTLKYKPLSVNDAWQGRRYKTPEYKRYERDLLLILPRLKIPEPPYRLEIEFGIPTLMDIDNPLKPLLDILQKKYGFNDRSVIQLMVHKTIVKKGEDQFIKISLDHAT